MGARNRAGRRSLCLTERSNGLLGINGPLLKHGHDVGDHGDDSVSAGEGSDGFIDLGHGRLGLAHGTLRMNAAA
jgi:hypothetical protein